MFFHYLRKVFLFAFIPLFISSISIGTKVANADQSHVQVDFQESISRVVNGVGSLQSLQSSLLPEHLVGLIKNLQVQFLNWKFNLESVEIQSQSIRFQGYLARASTAVQEKSSTSIYGFVSSAFSKVSQYVSTWVYASVIGTLEVTERGCSNLEFLKCYDLTIDLRQSNSLITSLVPELKIQIDLKKADFHVEKPEPDLEGAQFNLNMSVLPGMLFPGVDNQIVVSTLKNQANAWADAMLEYATQLEIDLVHKIYR